MVNTTNAPLENDDAVAGADVVCDLRGKGFVVHEEKVNLLDVLDDELLESVGEKMAGLKQQVRYVVHRPSVHNLTLLLLP